MSLIKDIWKNIKKRGLKDVTDIKTIKAFLKWEDIKANGLLLNADEILTFSEQVMYRQLVCAPCLKTEDGKCLHCVCHTVGKMSTPQDRCKQDKWEGIMSKEDWEQYKIDNKINIILL